MQPIAMKCLFMMIVTDLEFVRPMVKPWYSSWIDSFPHIWKEFVCVSVLASWKFLTASELIQTMKSQIIMPSFNHSLLSYRPQEDQSCQMKNICQVIYNFTGSLFSCMEIFISGLANAFKITVVFGRKKAAEFGPAVSILVQQWDSSQWYEPSTEFIVQRHKLLETSWAKRRHVAQPTEIH